MNSKVLENEYKIELNNGVILYYGALNEETSQPISILVRGKFEPVILIKDYKPIIKKTKDCFMQDVNNFIKKIDWIEPHYIFTSDFTECGIVSGKSCRWKFQIYITPKNKDNVKSYEQQITKLSTDIINILQNILEMSGFKL